MFYIIENRHLGVNLRDLLLAGTALCQVHRRLGLNVGDVVLLAVSLELFFDIMQLVVYIDQAVYDERFGLQCRSVFVLYNALIV